MSPLVHQLTPWVLWSNYAIIALFFILSIFWFVQILRARRWLKTSTPVLSLSANDLARRIYILIPALDEITRLQATVNYFVHTYSKFRNLKICIITTEAEYSISKKNNTIDLAKKLCRKYSCIKLYHYSGPGRKMSFQLNYAMREILKQKQPKGTLFAVYNADSRPDPNTFRWILGYLKNSPSAQVFQQYGDYTKNLETISPGLRGAVLASATAWQNRWSIGFEIPHALDQFSALRNNPSLKGILYPLNYCIGHGLVYTEKIFHKLGGFMEDTHNEDAIFGLGLSYLWVRIIPIPFFDRCESPDSLRGLYLQKSNWFFGPLQSFQYYRKIVQKWRSLNRLRLFVLSSKLFSHAVRWIVGPSLMVVGFVLTAVQQNIYLLLLMVISMITYLTAVNFFGIISVRRDFPSADRYRLLPKLLIGSIPFYFLHGLSAYRALVLSAYSKLFKTQIVKGKTPMRK